jgi:hypothetical protein
MRHWIERLLASPEMAGMGHGQSAADANLGLGWLYYALARSLRPRVAVVVGSYRGFVPIVIARAMLDNAPVDGAASEGEPGNVHLIDPSMVDDFWKDPAKVSAHFESFGVPNIVHHRATTQEFIGTPAFASIADVGMLYIDGYHTAEQARFDHRAFEGRLSPDAVVLFHDSVRERVTRIYGEASAYRHTVCRYMDELRRDQRVEVFSLPQADGVTLVKKAGDIAGRSGA